VASSGNGGTGSGGLAGSGAGGLDGGDSGGGGSGGSGGDGGSRADGTTSNGEATGTGVTTGTGAMNTIDAATISDFRLDKYLVSAGRFRRFVTAWDRGDGYVSDVGSGKHTHLNGGKGLADSGAEGDYEAG
jgi:hypothetical protein